VLLWFDVKRLVFYVRTGAFPSRQVTRYTPGGRYDAHHDYYPQGRYDDDPHFRLGRNRLLTFIVFLTGRRVMHDMTHRDVL